MGLIKRLFVGLFLIIGSLTLLVGVTMCWSVAFIPWVIYSVIAGIVRLLGINSMVYTLPGFIDACARPFD